LTAVVFDILVSLGDASRHGYGMLKEIEERTGRRQRAGTLYRALARLLEEGLVEEVGDVTGAGGIERSRYGLTALGRSVVVQEANRLDEAVRAARGKDLLGRA
jgi:DNA-binding PadR family transcriptional regulator